MPREEPAVPPLLAIGIAVAAVSTSSILIRWSSAQPVTIAFFRLAIATLILLPIALLREREALRNLSRRDAGLLVLVGAILAAHFATWITSLRLTTVASSTILVTSHPLVVVLASAVFLHERVGRRGAIGVVIAFVGAILLVWGDVQFDARSFLGDLLALAGGVAAGAYILAGRALRQRLPLFLYAALVYGSASLFLLPLAIQSGDHLTGLPQNDYLLFVAMAVVPSVMGHTLYNWSLRHVPATVVSVSLLGEPIGASLLAAVLLAEVPPSTALFGGAVVLAGIFLTATAPAVRSHAPAPATPLPSTRR